jgi:hypothetical protein
MRRLAERRKAVGAAMSLLVTFSLGVAVVVVAVPASASSSTGTTTKKTTTNTMTTTASTSTDPAAHYFVINGTVHAASDHEVLGSSAFPNYSTGAVDNYYSLAHSHVDNSPFAEGRASPFDTGPIGQTAAAGNTQQPQYADARWPGHSGKATYGNQGGPYAVAEASEYKATAEASEATSGMSGPSASTGMATPKGFNGRLRQKLAAWKAKWDERLGLKTPAAPVVVKPPAPTVTTPVATVTTPTLPVGGLPSPPPVSVPAPAAPPGIVPGSATPSRSLQSASPADGASLLESTTLVSLDPKSGALVTSGESRLGRVSIGGGQILLKGIHVSAKITNDGTPADKFAVTVAAATIGGVPVTIDQEGVHVAGQGQALPLQQASDALNGALKQAGIQLFLVAPEIKKGGDCSSSGDQTGAPTTPGPSAPTSTTTTTTSSSDDTGGTCPSSTGETGSTGCSTSSNGDGGGTTTGKTTTSTTTTATPTTSNPLGQGGSTTTTNASGPTGDTCTSTSGDTGSTCPTTSTGKTDTTTTTTTTTDTTTTSSNGDTGTAADSSDSNELRITATGVHVVFTQPVDQAGVPAQYVQHILGEVSLDSLAVPAGPAPNLNLDLNSNPCGVKGAHAVKTKISGGGSKGSSGAVGGGSSTAGGSTPSSSLAGSGTAAASTASPGATSSLTGGSEPASSATGTVGQASPSGLVSALRKKPLWLLVAFLVWQALMISTGVTLWKWRGRGAS